ncbi:hypothetical protein C8J57DRAFT_1246324 [Mycena rebaudengoi]|nr:hypothetical protein C8J57DRAFT_1246324 [Mycena rebaudengoi]
MDDEVPAEPDLYGGMTDEGEPEAPEEFPDFRQLGDLNLRAEIFLDEGCSAAFVASIYGTASSSGIHATVFHDELVPAKEILEKYQGSHFATVHLWYQIVKVSTVLRALVTHILIGHRVQHHSQIIEAISMEQYHERGYIREVSTNISVRLGSVVYSPGCEIWQEVACLRDPQFRDLPCDWPSDKSCQLLESGWTRYFTRNIAGQAYNTSESWLCRATQIIDNCTKLPSNYENYGLIDCVEYWIYWAVLLQSSIIQPARYTGPSIHPVISAWTQRRQKKLVSYHFKLHMSVMAHSWDELVYAGIREFHQAKAFDPYSQGLARELGYPLFEASVHETEVSGEVHAKL